VENVIWRMNSMERRGGGSQKKGLVLNGEDKNKFLVF